MISFDTETTGIDLRHGAAPFLVTTCREDGEVTFWEWSVDPLTRKVQAPEEDLDQIRELIATEDYLVLQNPKFDAAAMAAIGVHDWPWEKTLDTLLAGHLLKSNDAHDLTTMALIELGVNIEPSERALKEAVQEARRIVRGKDPVFDGWRIAKENDPDLPSIGNAGNSSLNCDYWLPRAVAIALGYDEDHEWYTVLSKYANDDSTVTLPLYRAQEKKIKERGLWEIYLERLKVLPIAFKMESRGVTINIETVKSRRDQFALDSERHGRQCVNVASSYGFELTLPKSGNNNSLKEFLTGVQIYECPHCGVKYREPLEEAREFCKKCKVDNKGKKYKIQRQEDARLRFQSKQIGLDLFEIAKKGGTNPKENGLITDSGGLCFDKNAIEHYMNLFRDTEPRSKRLHFVKNLKNKRKYDTAISYLEAYIRFALPFNGSYHVMHPNLNPTGTKTLRWTSSCPNEQNISKQETECEECFGEGCDECHGTGTGLSSIRECFGPAPGREQWSFDARGIEDRLPAYESGEQLLIDIFERIDEPPYYGSNHLLRFHTVYPEVWNDALKNKYWEWEGKHKGKKITEELVGPYVKKKYASTYYQWVKNGGFAVQYGAMDRKDGMGTADRAFHKKGAHALLKARFAKLEKLNQHCISMANKFGYVETMPDKTVSRRGYPLYCTRTSNGSILPTVPLNYHIQGTAMWWMMKAMIRVQEYLDQLNRACKKPGHYAIALQVHDELVLDFPKGTGPEPWKTNLSKVDRVRELMVKGGDDIGIPTPVSREYHAHNWSEGISV